VYKYHPPSIGEEEVGADCSYKDEKRRLFGQDHYTSNNAKTPEWAGLAFLGISVLEQTVV